MSTLRGDLVRDAAEDARRPREVRKRLPRRVEQVGLGGADFGRAEFSGGFLGEIAHAVAPGPVVFVHEVLETQTPFAVDAQVLGLRRRPGRRRVEARRERPDDIRGEETSRDPALRGNYMGVTSDASATRV